MKCRERGSHARSVYPTQDTSRMETARMKQKEESDKNNSKKRSKKYGRKERGHEVENNSKQDLSSAKGLTIELPEWPYLKASKANRIKLEAP